MILWSEPAIDDLIAVKNYIKRDSEFFAQRFVERIFEQVENLKIFPKIGRRVPEANDENIREVLLQNYRIIYKLNNDQLFILAIIHQAKEVFFNNK